MFPSLCVRLHETLLSDVSSSVGGEGLDRGSNRLAGTQPDPARSALERRGRRDRSDKIACRVRGE